MLLEVIEEIRPVGRQMVGFETSQGKGKGVVDSDAVLEDRETADDHGSCPLFSFFGTDESSTRVTPAVSFREAVPGNPWSRFPPG